METTPAQDPSYLRPGTQVGAWRVVSRHGRGTVGVVYRVERVGQEGGTPFALKLALFPSDPRFTLEGELLSRIQHGCVPRLEDSGQWIGAGGASYPFLVMQWVEGVPLYDWPEHHKLTSRRALRLLAQVARALEATHAAEGLHRDVKGANVLVEPGGRAVLIDFGSCTYRGAPKVALQPAVAGTPQYWSPECLLHQWRFRRRASAPYEARPADDVYALGVMAHRLVTGSYPPEWVPEGDGVVRAQPIEPEALVSVSPELAALLRRMLSADPSARGSAGEVAKALEQAANRAGWHADRRIQPRGARTSWGDLSWFGPRCSGVAWAGWLTAAALGTVLAIQSGWFRRQEAPGEPPVIVPAPEREEDEQRDGGTAALGNTALMTRVDAEGPDGGRQGLGVQMPKKPLPGQRLPPCRKYELMMYGACWLLVPSESPPCGDGLYEWKDACYAPVFLPGRPATSDEQ